jgi:hypothetical protein
VESPCPICIAIFWVEDTCSGHQGELSRDGLPSFDKRKRTKAGTKKGFYANSANFREFKMDF